MSYRVQMAQPRTWFDDIGLRAAGGLAKVEDCIVEATCELTKKLNEEGLAMAGKSVFFSTNIEMTKRATSRLAKLGIKIKAATEGRDLGLDREGRTWTRIATH
eukprot:3817977-Pyramimonas_sp.AAC.1